MKLEQHPDLNDQIKSIVIEVLGSNSLSDDRADLATALSKSQGLAAKLAKQVNLTFQIEPGARDRNFEFVRSIDDIKKYVTRHAISTLPDAIDHSSETSHWADFADVYDSIMDADPAMDNIRRSIIDLVPPEAETILDIGCGTGALSYMLVFQSQKMRVTAHDPERNMLELAKSKLSGFPNIQLTLSSAQEIQSPDNEYDVVISNFSLHHLENNEKIQAAHEIFRVLKPNGTLIFGDQFCDFDGRPVDEAWTRSILDTYTEKAKYYLETAGFDRMLLQMKILPRMLTADGEILVSEKFWQDALAEAGFADIATKRLLPEFLMNSIITATKPD